MLKYTLLDFIEIDKVPNIATVITTLEQCKEAVKVSDVPFQPNTPYEQWRKVSTDLAVEILNSSGRLEHVVIDDLRELLRRADEITHLHAIQIMDAAILGCGSNRVELKKELIIAHSFFTGQILLHGTYHNRVHLSYNHFLNYIHLGGSVFDKDLRLCSSHLYFGGNLGWSEFKGRVDCRNVQFHRNAPHWHLTFDAAIIHDVLDFTNAKFDLGTELDLSDIRLLGDGKILLDMKQIGKCQRIPLQQLVYSSTENIHHSSASNHGILIPLRYRKKYLILWILRRIVFPFIRRLERKWPSVGLLRGEDTSDPEELGKAAAQYNMLRDNFRSIPSKDDEEDRCHYKYKDMLRKSTINRPIWRYWDWAINKWCLGYGTYWYRTLLTAVIAILIFALLYEIAFVIYGTQAFECPPERGFSSLYFSLITFTTIGYGDYAPLGAMRYIAGIEGLLGLIIMALFTVTFARKIIR